MSWPLNEIIVSPVNDLAGYLQSTGTLFIHPDFYDLPKVEQMFLGAHEAAHILTASKDEYQADRIAREYCLHNQVSKKKLLPILQKHLRPSGENALRIQKHEQQLAMVGMGSSTKNKGLFSGITSILSNISDQKQQRKNLKAETKAQTKLAKSEVKLTLANQGVDTTGGARLVQVAQAGTQLAVGARGQLEDASLQLAEVAGPLMGINTGVFPSVTSGKASNAYTSTPSSSPSNNKLGSAIPANLPIIILGAAILFFVLPMIKK